MFIYLSPPSAPVCVCVCTCLCLCVFVYETRSVITPFFSNQKRPEVTSPPFLAPSCNAAAMCVMNMQRKYQFIWAKDYNECMGPGKILLSWSNTIHFPLHSLSWLPLLRGCNYAKSNFKFQVCKYQYRLATNRPYKGEMKAAAQWSF